MKKEWMAGLGEAKGNPMGTDELLQSKISERRRKEIEREEEKADAKHEADMAEWRRKKESAEKETEKIESKTATPPEPPIKVTGEIGFGKIDYQQMMQEAQVERDRLRRDAEEQAKTLAGINEDLREKMHLAEIKVLETTLNAQIQQLGKMVELSASKKSFMQEYNDALEVSKALGLARPSSETSDLQTTLALKKLEFDQTTTLRTMAREDKAEERKWQLDLRRLDDERDARKQEQERQRKKDEMFANAPEMIGRAIAKGIVETQTAPSPTPKGKMGSHIEAGWGEAGETQCPSCGETMAVGPTARVAECAKCNTRVPIRRVGERSTEAPEPRIEPEEE